MQQREVRWANSRKHFQLKDYQLRIISYQGALDLHEPDISEIRFHINYHQTFHSIAILIINVGQG